MTKSREGVPKRAAILVLLMWCSFAGCGGCGCGDDKGSKKASESSPELREIVLFEPPLEQEDPSPLSEPRPTVRDVLVQLDAVRSEKGVRGLFLRVGPFGGSWGRVGDLQHALAAVRNARKPIHCHFDMADSSAYLLLATSCDRISMSPAGDLDLVGVAAHVFYARTLLQNLGIRADLMQIGRYKGAADPFTRDDMPETTRESLGAVLDDFHGALARALTEKRRIPTERARNVIDEGPYDAQRAQRARLIDDVAFDDEAREHAKRAAKARSVKKVELLPETEPPGLSDILRALSGEAPETEADGARVGLIYLDGTITDSEEDTVDAAKSGAFVRTLRRMARDDEIKALVLRIDSPGGSALASDRMWHAVRRFAKRKPVIASIGDMAASGGYYIASAATEVIANDNSLVGSIGVVGGKVVFEELAKRVGLNVEVLQRGNNAAYASPARPFTESERTIMHAMMLRTYDRFLRRVSEGRGLSRERLLPAAEGRLMSGTRAHAAGLVNRMGGLTAALARARNAGGLPADAPVERWPPRKTLLDVLAERMGGGGSDASTLIREAGAFREPLTDILRMRPLLLGRERVYLTLPYALQIH